MFADALISQALDDSSPSRRLATPRRSPAVATAQVRPPSAEQPPGPQVTVPPEPGSELTVTLMTMGVGEQVWEEFGHNALWLGVERAPSLGGAVDVVYNWGIFDSSKPHFIPHFLQGLMLYSMGGYPLQQTLIEYRERDRAVWAQELDLTNTQKVALRDFIIWNSRPENANYRYDYYLDNCSTRVRDALDRVLGGVIRATFSGRKTDYSYRSETLRLTQRQSLLASGIDIRARASRGPSAHGVRGDVPADATARLHPRGADRRRAWRDASLGQE